MEEGETKIFEGIGVEVGAKIVLWPSFGVTMEEIRGKIKGVC